MKKITIILFLVLTFLVGIYQFIHTVTFVPFVSRASVISNFNETKLVTLPAFFYELKIKYPNIKKIATVDDLKINEIILLPWNTKDKNLSFIKVNNMSFYESKEGVIQIYSIRKNDDGYESFITNKVVLTAAGTVVLARGVHNVIQKHNDINFPWKNTSHLFNYSDINLINFKSPLIKDYKKPNSRWLLYGKESYVKGLVDSRINLAAISGNHMGDAGEDGLIETIKILNENKIKTVGAGQDKDEAYKCVIIEKKKTKFGFLSFNNVPGSVKKATKDNIGIAWLDNDALDAVKKCKNQVDQLITIVNWGIEYVHTPRDKEIKFAKNIAKNGADIIIGDQAHWVQNFEQINNTHVSYGLGNYIFDQHWSENTTEGIIQKYIFNNNKLIFIDTIPIKLHKNGSIHTIPKKSNRYQYVMNAYNNKLILKNKIQK